MSGEWEIVNDLGKPGPVQQLPADTGPLLVPREQIIRTPKPGYRGQLAAAAADLYTAPSDLTATGATQGALLKSIILCNTDTVQRTFTLYAVESGGSTADDRALFKAATIEAGETLEYIYPDDSFPLGSGEKIRGLASAASKVTIRIGVIELTS